jgi:hypothetical protein
MPATGSSVGSRRPEAQYSHAPAGPAQPRDGAPVALLVEQPPVLGKPCLGWPVQALGYYSGSMQHGVEQAPAARRVAC